MFASTGGNAAGGLTYATRRGGPLDRPPIIVAPARNFTSFMSTQPGWIGHVLRALVEDGWPVLSGNMGGLTTHGNAASATAVGTVKDTAEGEWDYTGPVGALATSMGSLAILRHHMDAPTDLACTCFGVPNLNLQDVHDVKRTDLATEIETAHGGSSGYNAYLADYNPADHTADLADLPQLIYYATNDPNFTNTVAPAYCSATGATGVSLGAVGHNPTSIPAGDVVDFFRAHLT